MDNVTVKRDELLARIRSNRDAHRDLFLKAQDGYRARVIEELDRMLDDAKAGRKIRRSVQMAEPQDHTADYDMVIDMLEMATTDSIEISQHHFKCYVRDEWNWKAAASMVNTAYSSGSAMYVGEDAGVGLKKF